MGIQGERLADIRSLSGSVGNDQILDHQPAAAQKQGWSCKGPLFFAGCIPLPRIQMIRKDNLTDSGNSQVGPVDPHRFFIYACQDVQCLMLL
ncbi:hypothetical protein D3C73_1257670 [compost metagenome]